MSDVFSVNLELPFNISFGNSHENLMNEEPLGLMKKLRLLNLIIFSKRQLNKKLLLWHISGVMTIKSNFILGFMPSIIRKAPPYSVFAFQLIFYACCSNYINFLSCHKALATTILLQGYKVVQHILKTV